jgi:hypothetical protein
MGGNDLLRGRGRMISDCMDPSDAEERERVGELIMAGSFLEAAVDGLMSCFGDGARLIETDWIAEAISEAGFDSIAASCLVPSVKSQLGGRGRRMCGTRSLGLVTCLRKVFL